MGVDPLVCVMMESADPTVIRSIAVKTGDVVAALEMNRTTTKEGVLRVTPPFRPRMRARLHVIEDMPYTTDPAPLHIDPAWLLPDDIPSYPRPADSEDDLRSDPDRTYSIETHHEFHQQRVVDWRSEITQAILEQAVIETPSGLHKLEVKRLAGEL